MPTGLQQSARAQRARTVVSVLRVGLSQVSATTRPHWPPIREQTQYTESTPKPKKKEPWQLTHTANKGGNSHSQRRLRIASSRRISSITRKRWPRINGRMARPTVPKNQAHSPPMNAAKAFPEQG